MLDIEKKTKCVWMIIFPKNKNNENCNTDNERYATHIASNRVLFECQSEADYLILFGDLDQGIGSHCVHFYSS